MQEMRTNPDLILSVTECTHREATRDHLDQCCADGIDCDNCGQPIPGLTGPMLAVDEVPICRDCGLDNLERLNA